MSQQNAMATSSGTRLKTVIGSLLGVFVFFVPVPTPAGKTQIPLVIAIDYVKDVLGTSLEYLTLAVVVLLCITWLGSRLTTSARLKHFHRRDSAVTGTFFILAVVFAFLLVFRIGPGWFLDEDVGALALSLGGNVLLTVSIAGFFVVFLTEFGLAEFVGTLMEPLMRPVYRVPGRAAVDAVASFVASPAVGVYITSQIYREGNYTAREAAFIASNFSVVSIGFFALLASIGGILPYLPYMLLTSFIVTFIVAIAMCRLPPLSRKKDVFFDGSAAQTSGEDSRRTGNIVARAWHAATERAASAGPDTVARSLWEAVTFAFKIVAYVLAIATPALIIAHYTPLFEYLGVVFEPLLHAMGLPDVEQIAPTILVGIAEVALPAIIISGAEASAAAVFFVCTLSTIQIIFFTESANAMLESEIPLNAWDLVLIFLIRTLIAIPFVALATHSIF